MLGLSPVRAVFVGCLLAGAVTACSGAPTSGSAAASVDGSLGGDGAGSSGGVGSGSDGGAGAGDASSHDAAIGDGGPSADGASSLFGTTIGDDPCVATGTAPAWVTTGRCAARPGRTPTVSSQSGAIAHSIFIPQLSASLAIPGEPTFASDGSIYTNSGHLAAIDPTTFTESWTLPDAYTWPPVVGPDGTLYVSDGGIHRNVTARDPVTHSVKWTRDMNTTVGPPTVLADGSLALLTSGAGVLQLEVISHADGSNMWAITLAVPGAVFRDSGELVSSTDGTIYVASVNGGVYAISPSTHAVTWNVPGRVDRIALDDRAHRLFVLSAPSTNSVKVGSLATNGTGLVFGAPFLEYGTVSDIALGEGGWVYFGAQNKLVGYDTTTNTKWEGTTGAWASSPVVGGDGTVYYGADKTDGLYAMAFTKTGTLRWDKLLTTTMKYSTEVGAGLSIASTGHLLLLFPKSAVLFALGP